MKNVNINPYGACFCGSGKKFKFCCMKRFLDRSIVVIDDNATPEEDAESKRLHEQGLSLMAQQKLEEALSCFQKAAELRRSVPNPVNNWSMCLFALGKPDEAIQVQRRCLSECSVPNAFGLANLSTMLHFKGEDEAALNAVSSAMLQVVQDISSVQKICMALSFFDLHQDILDIIDLTGENDDPLIHFYAGCAAANLGDSLRAIRELSEAGGGDAFGETAKKYLKQLCSGKSPETVRGNWAYLPPNMFFMEEMLHKDKPQPQFLNSSWYVQYVEAVLNYTGGRKKEILDLLRVCTHPSAVDLLWKVEKGSFGSDALRQNALALLQERGAIGQNETVEILAYGEKREMTTAAIKLNPEYEYCSMPEGLLEPWLAMGEKMQTPDIDWADMAEQYRRLFEKYPDYFPLEFNLGIALRNCGQAEEGKKMILSVAEKHPDYLFAKSGLLECYTEEKRWEEGEKLFQDTAMPEETHPQAYASWVLAVSKFFFFQGKIQEAESWLKMAKQLFPENIHVKYLASAIREEKKMKKICDMVLPRKAGKKRKAKRK